MTYAQKQAQLLNVLDAYWTATINEYVTNPTDKNKVTMEAAHETFFNEYHAQYPEG